MDDGADGHDLLSYVGECLWTVAGDRSPAKVFLSRRPGLSSALSVIQIMQETPAI
jgi:hypothetical protein